MGWAFNIPQFPCILTRGKVLEAEATGSPGGGAVQQVFKTPQSWKPGFLTHTQVPGARPRRALANGSTGCAFKTPGLEALRRW